MEGIVLDCDACGLVINNDCQARNKCSKCGDRGVERIVTDIELQYLAQSLMEKLQEHVGKDNLLSIIEDIDLAEGEGVE